MLYDKARVPVVALDYTERQMAQPKEFIVDYDNGKLYIMSKDGTRLMDITTTILKAVKGEIVASDVIINIDGIGDITLKEILEQLLSDEASFFMEEELNFAPDVRVDNASIMIKDFKMQIDNFDIAAEGSFPKKTNGRIQWVSNAVNSVETASSITAMNGESNTLILSGNKIYKLDPSVISSSIILDDIDTDYALTKLVINIGYTIPAFIYAENIKWCDGMAPTFAINTIFVIEFETFDKGANWLAKCVKYR